MNILRRFLVWLSYQVIWLALPAVVIEGAEFAVLKIDPTPHTGDQKHQLVYAKLLKQYPTIPKRILSLAVEAAIQKRL